MDRAKFDDMLTAALPQIERSAQLQAARFNMRDEWRDIAQDVVLRLLRYRDRFDPGRGSLMQWCATMIMHRVNERVKERMGRPEAVGFDDAADLPIRSDTDICGDLQAACILDRLSPEARMYYEGYNLEEIARASGLRGRNGAKWRIDACARKLAKALGLDPPMGRRSPIVNNRRAEFCNPPLNE